MNRILAAAIAIIIGSTCLASDIPTTNWGAVLKVPLDKVEEVDKGLIDWGNWIKETHPMGDEDMGLDSLTITKSNPSSGFIYYVSLKGITGASHLQTDEVASRLQQLRQYTGLPFCVGFGIKDATTAQALAPHADGVVVGSALVNTMAQGGEVGEVAARLQQQVATIRQGIDAADHA